MLAVLQGFLQGLLQLLLLGMLEGLPAIAATAMVFQ